MKIGVLVALAVAAFAASGCTGPSARVKSDDEGDLVDTGKGGTETYLTLVNKGTNELLAENRRDLRNASERPVIAFVGVENKSSEELGEFRASMNSEIETVLVNAQLYSMLSMRAVDAAKREANVRSIEDLTTRRGREAFMSVLNRDGVVAQYLLFGEITSMTSRGNAAKERTYELTLQLIDSSTGAIQSQKKVKLRKEYTE
jgi:hypothetical protein